MLEINESECLTIVKKATGKENIAIEKCSNKHFGDFLGYLGEYYRLKITAKIDDLEAEEFQFFVKSLPIIDMRNRRQMLIETGIFKKEMNIYEKILKKFIALDINDEEDDRWCPVIYLVRDDLIVFNDLNIQHYKVLPFDTFDFPQNYVHIALKSLANFHACSITYEKNEKATIGKEFSDILFETSVADISWFTAGLDIVKNIAAVDFNIENSEIFYKKILNVIDIMESSPFDVPKVLCHRDLYKNNLMFREDPPNCTLIDFQTSRYLSLSVDVTMAIICTTNRQHYEKMMNHYLKYYYEQLERKLLKFNINLNLIMSFDNYMKSCEYHKKFSLVYKTFVVTLVQVPYQLFNNFTENDYNEFASGDRYSLVRKFMEQDELFKERLLDAVDAVIKGFL